MSENPICVRCGSPALELQGLTPAGNKRWRCTECDRTQIEYKSGKIRAFSHLKGHRTGANKRTLSNPLHCDLEDVTCTRRLNNRGLFGSKRQWYCLDCDRAFYFPDCDLPKRTKKKLGIKE